MRAALHVLLILAQVLIVLFAWAMRPFQDWDDTHVEVDADRTLFVSFLLFLGMLVGAGAWVQGARGGSTLRWAHLFLWMAHALLAMLKWFPHYRG
jgi:hypothetical protein